MLLDGPAVLGDPAKWPNQTACLKRIEKTVQSLIDDGTLKPVDARAATWLLNGAVLNAALWIAAADDPDDAFPKAVEAFRCMASGLLAEG
jgi:hypothetical protein